MTHPLAYHSQSRHPRTRLLRATAFAGALFAAFLAAAMPMKYLFSDWIPPVIAAYLLVLLISAAVAIKSTASLRARTPERCHIDRLVFALIIVAGFVFLLRNTILDDVMVFRPG